MHEPSRATWRHFRETSFKKSGFWGFWEQTTQDLENHPDAWLNPHMDIFRVHDTFKHRDKQRKQKLIFEDTRIHL